MTQLAVDRARAWRPAAVLAAAAATASAVAQAGPGITGLGPVRSRAFLRLGGQGDPSHVALTFDDGPYPVTTPLFTTLLTGVIVIVGALTFFPVLALGPVLEHLLMRAGSTF